MHVAFDGAIDLHFPPGLQVAPDRKPATDDGGGAGAWLQACRRGCRCCPLRRRARPPAGCLFLRPFGEHKNATPVALLVQLIAWKGGAVIAGGPGSHAVLGPSSSWLLRSRGAKVSAAKNFGGGQPCGDAFFLPAQCRWRQPSTSRRRSRYLPTTAK